MDEKKIKKLKELIIEARKLDMKFARATNYEYRINIERYFSLKEKGREMKDGEIFFSPFSVDLKSMGLEGYLKITYHYYIDKKNRVVIPKIKTEWKWSGGKDKFYIW